MCESCDCLNRWALVSNAECIRQAFPEEAIRVWRVSMDLIPEDMRHLYAILSPDERRRAETMMDDPARRAFVVGRAALREILASCLDAPPQSFGFEYSKTGKPRLLCGNGQERLRFNVSHSGGLVLVAVSEQYDVGVDVERVVLRKGMDRIIQRLFSITDQAWLDNSSPEERLRRFLRMWCRREAVLKSIGKGARYTTESIDWSAVPVAPKSFSWTDLASGAQHRMVLSDVHPGREYVAAVAGATACA